MSMMFVVVGCFPCSASIRFEHVPRAHNKHADTLATSASKIDVFDEEVMCR